MSTDNSREVELRIKPEEMDRPDILRKRLARRLGVSPSKVDGFELVRRSIDSRGRSPKFVLRFRERSDVKNTSVSPPVKPKTRGKKKILIAGAGPAGYFAALRCLALGMQPIILERGKDVRTRRRDLRQIQQFGIVHPDSNYCFGEGGAGTYSDGKLYTRINKKGNIREVLQTLVDHGANPDILIDAHPHIGSNKLPGIVSRIRETIESSGGQIHFNSRVVDFITDSDRIIGLATDDQEYLGDAVILCTGHSARDIYSLCVKYGLDIQFKPFAIGVRIEHPQAEIDRIQYGQSPRHEKLPAASYRLASKADKYGVFSFCMCPGGLIVPTATAPGELVVNGMSLSKRDSPFANSGLVVSLDQNPTPGDPFGGMKLQGQLEQKFFERGDGSQRAPAQRVVDFIDGRESQNLEPSSYIPGVYSANFKELLPKWIYQSLHQGLLTFDRSMRGYLSERAQIVGLESRTSAPIRINRAADTTMSKEVLGLFPCGEGAGYAGGILSAALDGIRVAVQASSFAEEMASIN